MVVHRRLSEIYRTCSEISGQSSVDRQRTAVSGIRDGVLLVCLVTTRGSTFLDPWLPPAVCGLFYLRRKRCMSRERLADILAQTIC